MLPICVEFVVWFPLSYILMLYHHEAAHFLMKICIHVCHVMSCHVMYSEWTLYLN
jgi:hypothetical protein